MITAMLGAAALAQAVTPAPATPAPAAPIDYNFAQPVGGNWSYGALADGSEARFTGPTGVVQLALRCTRSVRHVTIAKSAGAAAASLRLWTSGASRTFSPGFDAAAGRVTVTLLANDSLLDAMVFSRGRIAVAAGSDPALVVPPWPEIARVVEDCRI